MSRENKKPLKDASNNWEKAAHMSYGPNTRESERNYEDYSKDELLAKADEKDIEGRSIMSKGELIEALRKNKTKD